MPEQRCLPECRSFGGACLSQGRDAVQIVERLFVSASTSRSLPPEIAEFVNVKSLIERGESQGYIASDEVRQAFEADQIPATQWKNVLRSLNQVLDQEGVTIMVSAADSAAPKRTRKSVAAKSAAKRTATKAVVSTRTTGAVTAAAGTGTVTADPPPQPSTPPAPTESAVEVPTAEAPAPRKAAASKA